MEMNQTSNMKATRNKVMMENDEIEEVIRGEISAAEAYEQVMESLKTDPEAQRLQSFHEDHLDAVDYWKEQSMKDNILDDDSSGIWGTAVKGFVGLSKLFGSTSALAALREGEEYGLKLYKDLVKSENLSEEQKEQISTHFIPLQEKHIDSLNAIIKLQ